MPTPPLRREACLRTSRSRMRRSRSRRNSIALFVNPIGRMRLRLARRFLREVLEFFGELDGVSGRGKAFDLKRVGRILQRIWLPIIVHDPADQAHLAHPAMVFFGSACFVDLVFCDSRSQGQYCRANKIPQEIDKGGSMSGLKSVHKKTTR